MNDAPLADVVNRFRGLQSGIVCDALGRLGLAGWMEGIHPLGGKAKVVGRARTMRYAPQRGAEPAAYNIYKVIRSLEPGDVLVLETGLADSWIFGENMAHTAMYQGLSGMITDCCARDGAELAVMKIACYARGLATRPPGGIEIVGVDVPIRCAGAQVRANDLIVGDADGIVVVPGPRIVDVLVQAEDLEALEKEQEIAIRDRVPLPELLEVLAKKKVRK